MSNRKSGFFMNIKFYKSVLLILLSAFYVPEIHSQNSDSSVFQTPEIIVHSNKFSGSIFTSPVKIQYFDRSDIINKNGNTLSDVLQTAGSMFIKNYGGSGSLNTVSMNGLGAEHTLILLNGLVLNSPQNAQTDLSLISKDNIRSIEILNNGSGAIYGSNAIGGVINIQTNDAADKNFNFSLNGQIGSYSQKKILFGLSKAFNNLNVNASASNETSDNDYDYYFYNGTDDVLKSRVNSAYNINHYNLQLKYILGNNSRMEFYTDYADARRNQPGIETGNEPSNAIQKDYNWNNIVTYHGSLSDNLTLKSQMNFRNDLSKYDDGVLSESYYKNICFSNLSQLQFNAGNSEFITGFELGYSGIQSNELTSSSGRYLKSVFMLANVKLSKYLSVYPSARFEHYSDIDESILTLKAGLNYKPFSGSNLHLKFSAGNNFSAPTFNELYWNEIGNKNLNPESSLNADAGIIFELPGKHSGIMELTYTYINATDKIIWMPNSNGLWIPGNIGKSVSNIFSADYHSADLRLGNMNFNADLNYSYTSSLKNSEDFPGDPSYKKMIIYIPQQLLRLNLNAVYENSGLNLFYSYTGMRFTDVENRQFLPSINLIDGNIFQKISIAGVSTQIKFEVNNIFNLNYQVMSGYPMPLRNYKFNLNLDI